MDAVALSIRGDHPRAALGPQHRRIVARPDPDAGAVTAQRTEQLPQPAVFPDLRDAAAARSHSRIDLTLSRKLLLRGWTSSPETFANSSSSSRCRPLSLRGVSTATRTS